LSGYSWNRSTYGKTLQRSY
jgi:hypothetical protein